MVSKESQTKRQKIKALQKNELNKSQQQPRIKSTAARTRGYIIESGLTSKLKPQDLLNPELDLNSPEIKFGRALGSSEARARHRAVNALQLYLKARVDIENEDGGLSELDLMKLWKGLWYCLYMADKVPVQDDLSKRLSELIWCLGGTLEEDEYAARMYLEMHGVDDENVVMEEDDKDEDVVVGEDDEDEDGVTMKVVENTLANSNDECDLNDDDEMSEDKESNTIGSDEEEEDEGEDHLIKHCRGAHLAALFVRTFFITVRREWGNMDKYRVDKFYTLIRLMMREVYKYMATRHWNLGIIRLFNDAIYEEILSKIPNGIRLHLIDLSMDELAKANKTSAPLPLTEQTFLDVNEPFFAMCQTEKDSVVQKRVLEGILEKFLYQYSVVSNRYLEEGNGGKTAQEEEDDDENFTFDNVHVGSIAEFIFTMASDEETRDRYRESLYSTHKAFVKRIKKVGKDVDIDEEEDEDEIVLCQDAVENASEAMSRPKQITDDSAVIDTKDEPAKKKNKKNKKKKTKKQ